ncbi:IpaB/EvcA family protein [Pediococcus stilesii]|uniref:IpaB/EvcA family protein n=1 Tax=Pediococcus stilesii TaxID=331679 RepID=A0A5R9BUB1_9LACO|nr:IpaB/EvcA family protein [Pediococcus stilesii]TLQ03591.1 IpaB/EvcA family protein [Pediococcus stilesii]
MSEVTVSDTVKSLLEEVNASFPGEVRLSFGDEKAGYVRHDQSQQYHEDGKLLIKVNDITAPDYTASHELIHMLMILKGFPQLYFQLSTGEEDTDNQLMFLITELYDVIAHEVVVAEQRRHYLIDDEIEEEFFKGILDAVEPEKDGAVDGFSAIRLIMMMDAITFYGEYLGRFEDRLIENYPTAYQTAQTIMKKLNQRTITTPFDFRRKVIKAFTLVDEQLKEWGLPELHALEFATLGSVFSERQLRLSVKQLFQIFHSDLHEKAQDTRGFVGLGISDQQNAFVVPTPSDKPSDEYFRELYAKNVKEFFEEMQMPYTIR